MANHIKRGESLLIPFRNGLSISDSQNKPRMYKTKKAFEKAFPKHYYGTDDVELVEYAEVRHGRWIWVKDHWECSGCRGPRYHDLALGLDASYCGRCGAKMDGENNEP